MRLYVEIAIRGTLDDVWRLTQTPELHERFDLRFTRIEYLPRAAESDPQRFLYATRIGFGLEIRGTGESVTTREDARGARTSSLRFGSADRKSLIREGAGYWKYEALPDGRVRFLTGYDYSVRFGALGRAIDRVLFRPLLGWATAFSFDRLRLWVERGTAPETSLACALVHAIGRGAVAFAWLWHGLVPKILAPSPDEMALVADAGGNAAMLPYLGAAEAALGIATLFFHRARWPLAAALVLMPAALVAVAVASPRALFGAFGPVTTNLLVAALAAAALVAMPHAPTAAACRRRPEKDDS